MPQAIETSAIADVAPEGRVVASRETGPELQGHVERQISELIDQVQRNLAMLGNLAIEARHPNAIPMTSHASRRFRGTAQALRHAADQLEQAGDWAASTNMMRQEGPPENG